MKQAAFARVFAAAIPSGPVFAQAILSVGSVSQVVAPPEIRDGFACWTFADESGKVGCAIVAENFKSRSAVEMKFIAPTRRGKEFFDWATEKINLTENADLSPAFLVAHKTALRIERL